MAKRYYTRGDVVPFEEDLLHEFKGTRKTYEFKGTRKTYFIAHRDYWRCREVSLSWSFRC